MTDPELYDFNMARDRMCLMKIHHKLRGIMIEEDSSVAPKKIQDFKSIQMVGQLMNSLKHQYGGRFVHPFEAPIWQED